MVGEAKSLPELVTDTATNIILVQGRSRTPRLPCQRVCLHSRLRLRCWPSKLGGRRLRCWPSKLGGRRLRCWPLFFSCGRRLRGGLQGLLPGQCSASFGGALRRACGSLAWVWWRRLQLLDVLALISRGNLDILFW